MRHNKTKKEIVESILCDVMCPDHCQVKCRDRYIITNGRIALLLKNPFEDFPVENVTNFSENIQNTLFHIYDTAFAYDWFVSTCGKLDFDKIKVYEKQNRFSESKKLKATKSGWLSFEGKNYPIKQVLDFLYILKDATITLHGNILCFWNGTDAGLIMPCIIKDPIVRYDKDGCTVPYDRYAANYRQFLRDDS